MAYRASHPVEVGSFGRFKSGGKWLVNTWQALEDLCFEDTSFAGIYSQWSVLERGKQKGLIQPKEIDNLQRLM